MAKGKPVQEVLLRPLSELKPNPKNPRRSDPEGLENLKDSISRNPYYFAARPILLSDRTGELIIIAGERRSEAAAELGMTEVPTILLSGLTEEQEDEIMVRDNTHNGLWNIAALNLQWKGEDLSKWMIPNSWISYKSAESYNFKNKEVDINLLEDEMVEMKVKFKREEITFVQKSLFEIDKDLRLALLKILNYEGI